MTYLSAVAIPVYAVHGYAFGLDSKSFSSNVPGGTDSEVFRKEHNAFCKLTWRFARVFRAEHLWKTSRQIENSATAFHSTPGR
jgi:hypothetical protein